MIRRDRRSRSPPSWASVRARCSATSPTCAGAGFYPRVIRRGVAGPLELSSSSSRASTVRRGRVTAGEELVAKIRREMDAKDWSPTTRGGLLHQISQVADDIAELRQTHRRGGVTFTPAAKGGPPRAHPLIAELRQSRALLGRLLSQISLEESTRNPIKGQGRQYTVASA